MLNHGVGRVLWSEIAAQLPGRLGKQCRERWFNHLDPAINKGEWTTSEDRILYEGQYHFGNRWCEISKLLPGRTENAVKNRWNSSAIKRWLQEHNLEPGTGLPLEDISDAQGMQRVLNAFITALAASGVGISKETTTLLLSDVDGELPAAGIISFDCLQAAAAAAAPSSSSSSAASSSAAVCTASAGKNSSDSASKKRKQTPAADETNSASAAANTTSASVSSKATAKRQKVGATATAPAPDSVSASASAPKAKVGRPPKKRVDDSSGVAEAKDEDSSSQRRLSLPSHLRPPAIVTSAGSCDQDEVVEILSSMKHSPHSTQPSPRSLSESTSYFDAVLAGGGAKRKTKTTTLIKSSEIDDGSTTSAADSPTDRALKAVRSELARRRCYPTNHDGSNSHGNSNSNNNNSNSNSNSNNSSSSSSSGGDAVSSAGLVATDHVVNHIAGSSALGSDEGAARQQQQQQQQQQQPERVTCPGVTTNTHVPDAASVPFQLLPFFKLLVAAAQRSLMLQLIEHFQHTAHATTDAVAVNRGQRAVRDATDRATSASSNSNSSSISSDSSNSGLHSGSLALPFSFSKSMSKDLTDVAAASTQPQYSYSLVGSELTLLSPRGAVTIRQRQQQDDRSLCLNPWLTSAFNTAVNVAVKCATREASFEEVLSWLLQAGRDGGDGAGADVNAGQQHEEYDTIVLSAAPSQSQSQSQALPASDQQAALNRGMSLPSHLRPPAIVTTVSSAGAGRSPTATDSRPLSTRSCSGALDDDQQHDELVEILSAFKSNHNSPSNFMHAQNSVPEAPVPMSMTMSIPRATLAAESPLSAAATRPSSVTSESVSATSESIAERALSQVQQELSRQRTTTGRRAALREDSSGGGGAHPRGVDFAIDTAAAEESPVPFQLLPFFGLLDEYAQTSLMRQLVDHFQQTNFTPRNAGALLATPRFNDMQILENLGSNEEMWGVGHGGNGNGNCGDVFTYSISGNFLTLGSPRHAGSDPLPPLAVVDPHCFEEGFVAAAEGFLGSSSTGNGSVGESSGKSGKQKKKSSKNKGGGDAGKSQRVRDTVQSFLDAPVNAAVNIAVKCATREASFEEVLSWLLAASSSSSSSSVTDNRQSDAYAYSANSLLSCAFSR